MVETQERVPSRAPGASATSHSDRTVGPEHAQKLIDAAQSGNWSVIQEFLDCGGNVNQHLGTGWTLLLHASSCCQADMVRRLLEQGADPNRHHEGYTPLMALSYSSKEDHEQRMQCLRHLLEAKANVNASDKLRETPLMFACKMQQSEFVQELLEQGAHIEFADSEEWTPLFYAVANNRVEIVELLVSKGADLKKKNYDELSAYDVALTKGFEKIVTLLDVNRPVVVKEVDVRSTINWMDLFPKLSKLNQGEIDSNIEGILYGMGLGSYNKLFCGMDLATFLNLKEEDLKQLGVDLKLHRLKFADALTKFHKHEWSSKLVKYNFAQNFSSFEALKLLGNINKQLSIISSSVYFSKDYLDLIEKNKECSPGDKEKIKDEIKSIKITTLKIKDETLKLQSIVKRINEENSDLSLPILIGKKKEKKNNHKWVLITILSVATICVLKLDSVKRLSNYEKLFLKFLKHNPFNNINLFLQKS